MKYYHTSNPFNRDSILKNGLIPSVGDIYSTHYEEAEHPLIPVVFLACGKNFIFNSTYDDDIYQIDITGLDLKPEKDHPNWFICLETISPEKIVLIYKGTGNCAFKNKNK